MKVYILTTMNADPDEADAGSIVSSAHRHLLSVRQNVLDAEWDVVQFDHIMDGFETEKWGMIEGFYVNVKLAEVDIGLSLVEDESA